jgi:hypothetical protein
MSFAGGTGHAGRITGRMLHGMDDDLGVRGFVENRIREGVVVIRRIAGSLVRVPMLGCFNRKSVTA